MTTPRRDYAVINGVRAIVHISLVAMHSAMLMTGHLPSAGDLWAGVKTNLIYTFSLAGGIQVDVMFVLSAFLLVDGLLNRKHAGESVFSFGIRRALRMLPCILFIGAICFIAGDSWDVLTEGDYTIPQKVLAMCGFVMNYFPVGKIGSFAFSLCWSCCVDLHAGIVTMALFKAICGENPDSVVCATRMRIVFLLLVIISLAVRGYFFHENERNIFKLGQYSHFGVLMGNGSRAWIEEYYSHTWKTLNSGAELSFKYFDGMYMPSHTRFGPFAVGGVLACNVHLAKMKTPVATLSGKIVAWVLTILSIVQLAIPCFPAADEAPMEAQVIATMAVRTLAASASALIAYRALVPREHAWHWNLLSSFLALPIFAPIARLSFCSYLLHFRIILEMNFRSSFRALILNNGAPGPAVDPVTADGWIIYQLKLFLVSFVLSMITSVVMHNAVEKPSAAIVSTLLGAAKSSKKSE